MIGEVKHTVKKCLDKYFLSKMYIPDKIMPGLEPPMKELFERVQDIFGNSVIKGKNTSKFAHLLSIHCPLPDNYQQLKQRVRNFVRNRNERT